MTASPIPDFADLELGPPPAGASAEQWRDAAGAAGARTIWLAGRPAEHSAEHDGVDGYLYAGCDAIAVLETTLRDLGVA